jgi:N-sulfoglucosamine sulfohydrolase
MSTTRSILFLIADDWSPIARCYGNDVIRTPHIDALAERATIFDYGFCASPSCAVSRACILTGLYSHTHGQYGHSHGIHGFGTHASVQSLPLLLRENGVATACIGKKHVMPDSVYPFDCEPAVDPRSVHDMADRVRDFLQTADGKPFYCHVGFTDPHRAGPGFGNDTAYRDVDEQTYSPDEVVVPPHLPDIAETREELADYYQAISRFDQGIGAAVSALREAGRADDTLIVVTTDHAMPWPGAKASSYDSGHRCPLLVIRPGATGAVRSQALVNWCNFMPTFLDWYGIAPPDELPERSFIDILDDAEPAGWDETFFSHCFHEVTNYYPYRVLRGRRFKYVRNLAHELPLPLPSDLYRSKTWTAVLRDDIEMMGERPTASMMQQAPEVLYDLENDPNETINVIDDPAFAEVAAAMRQKVLAFRQRTADPWIELSVQQGELPMDRP